MVFCDTDLGKSNCLSWLHSFFYCTLFSVHGDCFSVSYNMGTLISFFIRPFLYSKQLDFRHEFNFVPHRAMYIITFFFFICASRHFGHCCVTHLVVGRKSVQCTMLPQNIRYNQHNSDQKFVVREPNVIVRYYRITRYLISSLKHTKFLVIRIRMASVMSEVW